MFVKDAMIHFNALNAIVKGTYPVKMSFALSSNYEALENELRKIEKERKRLCEEYADKDDEGNPVINAETRVYVMTDENHAAMDKEYDELMEQEIFPAIRTITEADVEKCETDSRYTIPSASDIRELAFMVKE